MSYSVVITPAGIVAPSYADIYADLQDAMRTIYGSDIYIDPDSQDGQMLAVIAAIINDANNALIAGYLSFAPTYAQGVGLSNVVKINGIRRLVPSNSTATVTIVGEVGTVINFGQVQDGIGQRWMLPDVVNIPDAGTIDVTATAVDPGEIQASPGTITEIATPVRGWQSVTNAASATPGNPLEDDATLRQRQSVSTAIPAISVVGAILGAIRNIIGVGRAYIYENTTGSTDANGVPGHSICCVVEGGDIDDVGATIQRYKTPGTGTYGSTAVTVTPAIGAPIVINFDELVLVQLYALVYVTAGTGFVNTTETAIADALAAWFTSLDIGQDSLFSKLWSPVNLTGDAAIAGTGQTQPQLDALGNTYNATAIYQARQDMIIQDGPFVAGVFTVHITNTASLAIGKAVALALDNGTYLLTTISNKVGVAITMANAIPAARSAINGAFMYVVGDLTVAFNEAAAGDESNTAMVVS